MPRGGEGGFTPDRSPDRVRLVAAIVIVPFGAFLSAPGCIPVLWLARAERGLLEDPLHNALPLAVITAVLAFLVTLCGALPVLCWLIRRGPVTLRHALACGVVRGNVPLVIILTASARFTIAHAIAGTLSQHLAPPAAVIAGFLGIFLLGSVIGVASGLVFWAFAIRGTDISA